MKTKTVGGKKMLPTTAKALKAPYPPMAKLAKKQDKKLIIKKK